MNFESAEILCAIEAVREAALLARDIQRELVTPALTKQDRSPVTVADFAVQAVVTRRLAERFPGAVLIGEESADALRLEEGIATLDQVTRYVRRLIPEATPEEVCGLIDRGTAEPTSEFWTLDPIDGTKGFLRREQYAVALAFIREGKVVLGVLGCPELADGTDGNKQGMIVVGHRGAGTWSQSLAEPSDRRQLSVSSRSNPAEARLLRSVESGHTNTGQIGELVEHLGIVAPPVPMDSQAKYAALAAGQGDILIRFLSPSRPDYRETIWDQAAGSIVVEEAGGQVTDAQGKSLDFTQGRRLTDNRGVLATNGHLHKAVLSAIRAIGV